MTAPTGSRSKKGSASRGTSRRMKSQGWRWGGWRQGWRWGDYWWGSCSYSQLLLTRGSNYCLLRWEWLLPSVDHNWEVISSSNGRRYGDQNIGITYRLWFWFEWHMCRWNMAMKMITVKGEFHRHELNDDEEWMCHTSSMSRWSIQLGSMMKGAAVGGEEEEEMQKKRMGRNANMRWSVENWRDARRSQP